MQTSGTIIRMILQNVGVALVVCLERYFSLSLSATDPRDLQARTLEYCPSKAKMSTHFCHFCLDGTTPIVRELKLPLKQEIPAIFRPLAFLKQHLEIVTGFRCPSIFCV